MILQRTPEWYEARMGKFTASCFHEVLSKPADKHARWSKTALKCIERAALQIHMGQYVFRPDNEATRWGMDQESAAIREFTLKTGLQTIDSGFLIHPQIQDVGATPDAIVLCPDGQRVPLQVKCHFNRYSHPDYLKRLWSGEDLKKMKSHYYCQVQGEIWVTQSHYGYFASYDPRMPEDCRIHSVKVNRDELFIEKLEQKVRMAIHERNEIVEKLRKLKTKTKN
jgi:hypothetical protein